MKKIIFALMLLAPMLLTVGCASKRLAKRGAEHEKAGFYSDAAGYYYQSLLKNRNNLDSKIGLKRSGQQVLDDLLNKFTSDYNQRNTKEAVYNYLEAKRYYSKISVVGVKLYFPEKYNSQYEEVKNNHLASSYKKGYQLLQDEQFTEAEKILEEIHQIDRTYKDTETLLVEARYEPKYREAKQAMSDKKYRKAYDLFGVVLTGTGDYKNAETLKEESLINGQVTIAVLPFEGNYSTAQKNIMRSKLESKLGLMTNPFLKVIDRSLAEEILKEQELNMSGATTNSQSFSYGQITGVKAFLQASLLSYQENPGKLSSSEKRGYIKNKTEYKDRVTGETRTKTTYEKISYQEYEKENSVTCDVSFKLISTETGEILASDQISITESDKMHYAKYEGGTKNIVPGYWKYKSRDSDNDEIKDNYNNIRKLKNLFKADKTIESIESLSNKAKDQSMLQVSRQVNAYNPE